MTGESEARESVPLWQAMRSVFSEAREGSSEDEAWRVLASSFETMFDEEPDPFLFARHGAPDLLRPRTVIHVGDGARQRVEVRLVEAVEVPCSTVECRGLCTSGETIDVQVSRRLPKIAQLRTLLHELIHVAEFAQLGGLALHERVVDEVAYVLCQALTATGLVAFTRFDFEEHEEWIARCEAVERAALEDTRAVVAEALDRTRLNAQRLALVKTLGERARQIDETPCAALLS